MLGLQQRRAEGRCWRRVEIKDEAAVPWYALRRSLLVAPLSLHLRGSEEPSLGRNVNSPCS